MHGWRRHKQHCEAEHAGRCTGAAPTPALPVEMNLSSEEPRFFLPAEAETRMLEMRDGARIRTFFLTNSLAHANVLLLSGRGDFLEKWADIFDIFHRNGFSVASWDWRGQGGSSRMCETGAGYIDSFDSWLADTDLLASEAHARLGRKVPWFIVGHSMGGHLALRWLADPARHHLPVRADMRAGILTAPLFGIALPWALRLAAPHIARFHVEAGKGEHFAWGQRPYGEKIRRRSDMHLLTSSAERFLDEERWLARNPALATGGASWNWLAAYHQSQRALDSQPLESLGLPMLILLAKKERIVRNIDTMRVARRLPNLCIESFDGAHELMRESATIRQAVFDRIFAFLESHL